MEIKCERYFVLFIECSLIKHANESVYYRSINFTLAVFWSVYGIFHIIIKNISFAF